MKNYNWHEALNGELIAPFIQDLTNFPASDFAESRLRIKLLMSSI